MSLAAVLALLLQDAAMSEAIAGEIPDEIVVVAKPGRCDLSAAGRTMRDPEFRARAAEWAAGRAVRVVVPADARIRCLAKIMFRLHDRGVTRAEFVDAPTTPTDRHAR